MKTPYPDRILGAMVPPEVAYSQKQVGKRFWDIFTVIEWQFSRNNFFYIGVIYYFTIFAELCKNNRVRYFGECSFDTR